MVEDNPIPRKQGRKLAGQVLPLRSGYGDLADYKEYFGHEKSTLCACGGPFTRVHIIKCTSQDQNRETTHGWLSGWLTKKRETKTEGG